MAQLYANPYGYDCKGFYFDSLEDYEKKYKANLHSAGVSPCEEYSIEFIDGSGVESSLWQMVGPLGQGQMDVWFNELEDLDEDEAASVGFLVGDLNMDIEDALRDRYDPILRTGNVEDAVAEFVDEIGGPENLSNPDYYFDYEAFGRDLQFDFDAQDEIAYKGMSDQEIGEAWVDGMGGVGELGKQTVENYFDYKALARDMGYNSEIAQFSFNGQNWVVLNAAGLG